MIRHRSLHFALGACLLAFFAAPGFAASEGNSASGTYRGRVVTERFLHRQAQSRQSASALSAERKSLVRPDVGDIAIVDTSNGVVPDPNFLDLQGLSLTFTPAPGGFSVASAPVSFDEAAGENGVPLALGDDDDETIRTPFEFPFYGESYDRVFVSSDGNLTFGRPDSASASRSLARAVSGPPRIAPLFADLDPSRTAAAVRVWMGADRAVVTWDGVPQFRSFGTGPRQSFQAVLHDDGRIEMHYRTATLSESVVGVMPGGGLGEAFPADFSEGTAGPIEGALAEVFQIRAELDIFAVARRFYSSHDDAYDFLVVFNDLGLSAGPGSFAFEVNVRNEILGIGDLLSPSPVFDFGPEFGSPSRLASFVNMGPLTNYPEDPEARVPFIGENTTLSVLGQEIGHRWLAYVDFLDSVTGRVSDRLLGRQDAHWSFFFNSNASVVEGNRIEDGGPGASPRFTTSEAVERFSELDHYIMGLRPAETVPPSFLVENPSGGGSSSSSRAPQVGVRFDGERKNITIEQILGAEGPRIPDVSVSQKEFRFAYVLLIDDDSEEPSRTAAGKLDGIRLAWEQFFVEAVGGRARGDSALVRQLRLSAWPAAGVVEGGTGSARVEIATPLGEDLDLALTSDSGALAIPASVTIPAGELFADFVLTAASSGVAVLSAEASLPGFETGFARIQVLDDPSELSIDVVSGQNASAGAGEMLPEPLVFVVRDANRLPYSGVTVDFASSGNGTPDPAQIVTDAWGRAAVLWTLPSAPGESRLTARLASAPSVAAEVVLGASSGRPALSSEGLVNAASFNLGPAAAHVAVAPGSLLSVFGSSFASQSILANSLPLPRELAGVRVLINGVPAPLLFVSATQINLQVPFEVGVGALTVIVENATGSSEIVASEAAATQPGIFFDAGAGFGAIRLPADGALAWDRAARPGEFLEVFATGLGGVSPAGITGEAASNLLRPTVAEVSVTIGNRELTPTFAGLAPGFAGLYQINVQLPADLPAGSYELVVVVDGRTSNLVRIDVAP